MCDEYDGRVLIGETLDERFRYLKAKDYCGPQRLHLVFHFGLLHSKWGPNHLRMRFWIGQVHLVLINGPLGLYPIMILVVPRHVEIMMRRTSREIGRINALLFERNTLSLLW